MDHGDNPVFRKYCRLLAALNSDLLTLHAKRTAVPDMLLEKEISQLESDIHRLESKFDPLHRYGSDRS